jgi:hypothetical protein
LPRQTVGICTGYKKGQTVAAVAAVVLKDDDGLKLSFPKRNPFVAGEAVTVHLDDRVGSEIFSIELRVYRSSYKGTVVSVKGTVAVVAPLDYELFYGGRVVARFSAPGYRYPDDARPTVPIPATPLTRVVLADEGEKSNKLGVLVTRSVDRPHTTVMAFLNSSDDDIFLITERGSFKYHNLSRDARCVFALDHRSSFSFERQVDWNYTIYEAQAHRVDRAIPLFSSVQAQFIEKNPWEAAFFSSPQTEMLHLAPKRIIHQDILCD